MSEQQPCGCGKSTRTPQVAQPIPKIVPLPSSLLLGAKWATQERQLPAGFEPGIFLEVTRGNTNAE